jgi:hypothetical protein
MRVRGSSEGGWRRVFVKNGCAQLHVFTRIYTTLLAVNVTNRVMGGLNVGNETGSFRLFPRGSS